MAGGKARACMFLFCFDWWWDAMEYTEGTQTRLCVTGMGIEGLVCVGTVDGRDFGVHGASLLVNFGRGRKLPTYEQESSLVSA